MEALAAKVIAKLLEQAMRNAGAWKDGPAARFVVDGYPRSEEQLRSTLKAKQRAFESGGGSES